MNALVGIVDKASEKGKYLWVVLAFIATIVVMQNDVFGHGFIVKTIPDFEMIDMIFYSTPDEILTYLHELDTFGRTYYALMLLIDMVLLVTFFMLLSTTMVRLLKKIGLEQKFFVLILVPFTRSLMDFIESVSLLIQTLVYPSVISPLLTIASIATPVKWVCLWTTLMIMGVLFIVYVFQSVYSVIRRKVIK